jgi:hypothetical protein
MAQTLSLMSRFDPALERFLCEQAVRNLRLRLVYTFVTRSKRKPYERFLIAHVTTLFVQLSQVMRLNGGSLPKDFEGRIAIFEAEFKINGSCAAGTAGSETHTVLPQ